MTSAALFVLIVIYLRVSTEEQAKKGFSLPEQREACRKKAEALARETETLEGRAVQVEIREFLDDFSGDILERPVLENIRAFVRAHTVTWFVCLDPDRFSRNLTAQLIITDEIERTGARMAFVQHNYEKTAEGRLFYQLRGAVAEFEKAKILERTTRGRRGRLKAGKHPNGIAPYGYRHNGETDTLEIWEPEARWVRQVFNWIARDQLNLYQVASQLRALGVPTKRGGLWRGDTVAYMVRNTTYMGYMVCNRFDVEGHFSHSRLPREKRDALTKRIRPESDWITVSVPMIVEPEEWHQAQHCLATISRRGGTRNTRLLSHLLRCGACGGAMGYHIRRNQAWIRCNRKYADCKPYKDQTRCAMPYTKADRIESAIWNEICSWLVDPRLLEAYLQEQKDDDSTPDQLAPLSAEITVLEQQLTEQETKQMLIIEKQQSGLLTERSANRMLATIKEQMQKLEEALTDSRRRLNGLQERVTSNQQAARRVVDLAESVTREQALTLEQLGQLDADQQRQLVRKIVRSVVINPDRTWRIVPF